MPNLFAAAAKLLISTSRHYHQLFGVTMEEAGFSKVVSVAVKEAYDKFHSNEALHEATPKPKPTQLFLDEI